MPVWLIILFVIFVFYVLSQIPVWVYVTLGGILAFCLLLWLLDSMGVFKAIGNWWEQQTEDRRCRIRKGMWKSFFLLGGIYLLIVHPVAVPAVVASVFLLRWTLRRLAAWQGRKQVPLLPAPSLAEFGDHALPSTQ